MTYDILCFSHLRWNSVFQRPQHVLSRFARRHRVFLIEEPEFADTTTPSLEPISCQSENVYVFRPRLRANYPFYVGEQIDAISTLTQQLLERAHTTVYRVALYANATASDGILCAPRAGVRLYG